ncbi:OLC1v1012384C1 [Oldenlandia corymbosa var. corymbosa]|uniref:OLC1v1012384C1 n=1 Tax=Oldenlandia corymbosa var. corymbosa TaxID=529605 RepID=A0AAV1DZ14_OLDCO|nr:OLC1v1012384C1 [Oldenlandia corymbosa var. corymbosa]
MKSLQGEGERHSFKFFNNRDIALVLNELNVLNSRLEDFIHECVISDQDTIRIPDHCELHDGFFEDSPDGLPQKSLNDLLSTCQKITTSCLQVKATISLCHRVNDDLLPKLKYPNDTELINHIKVVADEAADPIEDFLGNRLDDGLTNDFDQLMSESLEEESSRF